MPSTNISNSCKIIPLKTKPRFYKSRTVNSLQHYRKPKLHVVLSAQLVDIGHKPPDHSTLSSELYGVYCTPAKVDDLAVPNVDLLVQFEPAIISGTMADFRPSVVYWREEFWVPIIDVGQYADVLSAVLYRIEVKEPPESDILVSFS